MESVLQVRNLKISYRSRAGEAFAAVEDLSLDVAPGTTVGLMGESGCGKSSVALALLGLLPKENSEVSGSVRFLGTELLPSNDRALQKIRGAGISLIHQEPSLALSPMLRAGDQVAEVIRAHRTWPWKKCRVEALAMLDRVGLRDARRIFRSYPHQLSGGQCQRIVLAQALSCSPRLLIADEPTAHLDARGQLEFLALLDQLQRQSALALLLISHAPEVQARLADRILIMRAGRILEEGRLADLRDHSPHPYTRSLLRSHLRPSAPGESLASNLAAQELAR